MENQLIEMSQEKQTIGHLLLEAGKLNQQDAMRVIEAQKEYGLRFGDAAVKIGLVTDEDVLQVVSQQFDYDYLTPSDDSVNSSIIAAFKPFGKEVEALRALRSQLSLRWFIGHKSLVITAPYKNYGTSYISANLAVMFSQLGQNTLLIDADMRMPSQCNNFKELNKVGLSDILAKRVGIDAITSLTKLENLSVLSSGTIPPNPLELLGHGKFSKLHAELSKQYDVIIVDSPPALEFSDAQVLASNTKGAVIVAQKNKAEVSSINLVKEQLAIAGAIPVGVVLNNVKK